MAIIFKKNLNPFVPSLPLVVPEQVEESLGSGIAIPFRIFSNIWNVVDGTAKIKQSIFTTLLTPVGRRLNQRDFGSLLPYLLFERWDANLQRELTLATKTALQTWMGDVITVTGVTFDTSAISNQQITLIVQYTINQTNLQNSVSISLTSNGAVQLPASDFTIENVSIFS